MAFDMKSALFLAIGMFLGVNRITGEKFQEILRKYGDEIESPAGKAVFHFSLVAFPIWLSYQLVKATIELFRNGVRVGLIVPVE